MTAVLRLLALTLGLLVLGLCGGAWAQPAGPAPSALTDLPLESGLPVVVRAGVAFADVDSVDENAEEFTGVVDVRLQWNDRRLAFPASEAPTGFREWRGEAATAQLATIWSPDIALSNLKGEPTAESFSLRIFTDGRVELLRRVTGTFGSPMDVRRFPFDRQFLVVQLASRRDNADKVLLDYRQDDLAFSRPDANIDITGWTVGLIELARDPLPGWYGETYSRLRVALDVKRLPGETIPGLFVPLLACLLIPLLATWLNSVENGEFKTEAFELTNIIIGGLFAVIALNFTINSERSILSGGGNTVAWMFGLNYLTLAAALVINVALFRLNLLRVVAGRHVQHEFFLYITWALPVAVGASAVALILIAAA